MAVPQEKLQSPSFGNDAPLPAAAQSMAVSNENSVEERNPIFDALVINEGEVAGLVAYSIYKQNKRAWLDDFIKSTERSPTEAETRAYIIGESTQRRLATYRHLAEATLSGRGPDAPGPTARPGIPSWLVWGVAIFAMLALFALAIHNNSFGTLR